MSWFFGVPDIACIDILSEGKPMTKLRFCMISLCIFLLTLSAMAQIQNGQFTGTVTDASGAAVAGAKVTLTNRATNLSVTTTTNGTGSYTATQLPIRGYKNTVEAARFKTFPNKGGTPDARTTPPAYAQ